MEIHPRRRTILLDLGLMTCVGLAALAAVASLPRPEPTPVVTLKPVPTIRPVPHPRCFPEGTAGAADFRLCPDGLIDNPRSI